MKSSNSDDGKVSLNELPDYSLGRATNFYIPVAIQAISQSLTYPLVATVISRGPGGVSDYGAFAQGLAIFTLLSALNAGLLATGMVYGRNTVGFRNYLRLNYLVMFFIVACEFILSMPPMDGIIFSRLLVLEPTQQPIARDALLYCIPMNILFILRNPYQVSLYLARNSLAANLATIGRIVATLILATLFVKINFVGHYAGIIALTIPLAAECYMIRQLGRPYLKMLPEGQPGESPVREQLFFCTPLSFGSILLGLSGFMVAAFVSRAPEPIRMLPIHYISLGIVNPLAFAAMRMQAVVLSFPPKDRHASQTFVFAIIAGLTLAGITLIGQIPPVARYYFGKLQNLPAEDIKLAMRVIMIVSLKPLISALRGHAEGLAAWRRRPNATLAGQAVNLATLVCSLFVFLNLGVPGYMMGALADICAGLATFLTIRMGVAWSEFENRTIDYSTNFNERS